MTTHLSQSTTHAADKIIALSMVLKDKMESWSDVFIRLPDSQNINVTAGFITKWDQPNVIEILVEVRAPEDEATTLVRTQVIETFKDANDNERFNQASLHFTVDYNQARQLVEKGQTTTREDIAELLHANSSQLSRIIVSDQSGKDNATEQLLGKRYDFDTDELATISKDTEAELVHTMNSVLTKLQQTAEREANS